MPVEHLNYPIEVLQRCFGCGIVRRVNGGKKWDAINVENLDEHLKFCPTCHPKISEHMFNQGWPWISFMFQLEQALGSRPWLGEQSPFETIAGCVKDFNDGLGWVTEEGDDGEGK